MKDIFIKHWYTLPLLLVVWLGYRAFKKWREKKSQENKISSVFTDTVIGVDGDALNVYTTAYGIYEAFHGSMFEEDEQQALNLIKQVRKEDIGKIGMMYSTIKGKGYIITADFRKYLSDSQYLEIEHLFD